MVWSLARALHINCAKSSKTMVGDLGCVVQMVLHPVHF